MPNGKHHRKETDVFDSYDSLTVQLVVLEEGKILLVHNKKYGKKPSGWGMPGGGVPNGSEAEISPAIYKGIARFLTHPGYKLMGENEFEEKVVCRQTEIESPKIFLGSVKEGIEETGFILFPERTLFVESISSQNHNHDRSHNPRSISTNDPTRNQVHVILASRVLDCGELIKKTIETDDAKWFRLDELPNGLSLVDRIYPSHFERVKRAIEILDIGIEVKVAEIETGKSTERVNERKE